MIWHIIKYWVSLLIPTFYKRIQGHNLHRLNRKGPVIIAMNHPNAFTDPIAITYVTYPLRLHYMARGDAFKPGLIAWLLEQIGIVPIFRIQDAGKEGLKKNDETYRRVNALLSRNAKVIVFAEGLCIQERRLRPLKKGVARMVFGAYEATGNPGLCVIPVGINYSNPSKFRSSLLYNVGEPIMVKDFLEEYGDNPARAQKKFLETLEPAMKALITHVEAREADEAVYYLERLCKKNLVIQKKLRYSNLYNQLSVMQELTSRVNLAYQKDPGLVKEFSGKAREYFKALGKHGLKDWLIDPLRNQKLTPGQLLLNVILLLAGSPLYLAGLVVNLPALLATRLITGRLVKQKEFYSSFFIGFSMVTFPVFYLLLLLVFLYVGPHLWSALAACLVSALCGWFALYYHPFLLRTLGMARILGNRALAGRLSAQRTELMDLVNKF